jgi:hypothetical protein
VGVPPVLRHLIRRRARARRQPERRPTTVGRQQFVLSELFTFAGDAISRLDTFHIDLR